MHKLTRAASIGTSGNGGPGLEDPGGRCSLERMDQSPAPMQREEPGHADKSPRARWFREPHPKTHQTSHQWRQFRRAPSPHFISSGCAMTDT